MQESELGDLKTESKRTVEKIELNFEDTIYQGRRFKLKFFPWIKTCELKKQLVKEKFSQKQKQLKEKDIRLFYKNIELNQQNKNPFQLYKIETGSTIIIANYANEDNVENGIINPYKIFQKIPQSIINLVISVQSGLNAGRKPRLAPQGTSGTYFLQNNQKKKVAVYKPFDQEPYTPNNPRGYSGQLNSQGIRKGILSGQCATRQVAAYLLDANQHFHGIPATTYVQFYHPSFCYKQICENNPIVSSTQNNLNKKRTKHGSLQQFIQCNDIAGNFGSHQFDVGQVHKIAIFDLRTLNCDRNQANILVIQKLVGKQKQTTLVPIDHGLTFPDNFQIYQHQIIWMTYKQTKLPFSQQQLLFIQSIDPQKDCQTLRQKLGFRQICLRNFRIAQIFLKKLVKAGFSLYEIGKFAFRCEDQTWQDSQEDQKDKKEKYSQLQKLVKQAQSIYSTITDNGIKSAAQFQIGLVNLRKNIEPSNQFNHRQISSQQTKIDFQALTKKKSKNQETSIQKRDKISTSKGRPRNISLPNLKKKTTTLKDKRLKLQKKNYQKGQQNRKEGEKWGDLYFHYFEQCLDRFVKKKIEARKATAVTHRPARGRLFSQNIQEF